MLVTRENICEVLTTLGYLGPLALDTETTGLRPYLGHRPFSIQIGNDQEVFYFPIAPARDATGDTVLGAGELRVLSDWLANTPRTYFLQNAKFDLHHLYVAGFELHEDSTIIDTAVLARLHNSSLQSYSMKSLSQIYLGEVQKSDAAMDYVRENDLEEDDPDDIREGRKDKLVHFERIPLDIMLPYAEQDIVVTYKLGRKLLNELSQQSRGRPVNIPAIDGLIEQEQKVTKVVYRMEREGIRINRKYVKEGLEYAKDKIATGQRLYKEITGQEYISSSKRFIDQFAMLGIDPELFSETPKGNPKCDRKELEKIGGELALCILDIKNNKTLSNYFTGFLRFADKDDRIHTDFKQYGTNTGRFSSSDPNLQNLKKATEDEPEEDHPYPIRRAFIPDDGCVLVMADYKQMEYRQMLDYADEKELIAKVIAGLDLHQSTADMSQITRTHAKTLNFAILYGAGAAKIGGMLDMSTEDAKLLIRRYFKALPNVESFIDRVRSAAQRRGYVYNWLGRRISYPNPNDAYKAVNHLIQGGTADVMRRAMVNCDQILKGKQSKMLLTIHDEIVFNMHPHEFGLIPKLEMAMVSAYPYKRMPHAVDISHSYESLQDKEKGLPK